MIQFKTKIEISIQTDIVSTLHKKVCRYRYNVVIYCIPTDILQVAHFYITYFMILMNGYKKSSMYIYVIVMYSKNTWCFFAGLGICMIRDSNTAMLGQYFKKKRPFVEMILACSSGLGHSLICHLLSKAIK